MDNPTGLYSACEGLMFILLSHVLLDLMAWSNWLCGSLVPGPKEEEGPDFSYLHIISDIDQWEGAIDTFKFTRSIV